jgi:3'-5' exoribonuclease
MAGPMTISAIRAMVKEKAAFAELHAQVEQCTRKEGSNGKPFWELRLRDATDSLILRVWSDSPNVPVCESLESSAGVAVEGEFYQNGQFGMDARRWELRRLYPEESAALFGGSEAERSLLDEDYRHVEQTIAEVADPRLQALGKLFLELYGTRFRRSAAARHNHHARRGGLLQHTSQMMRSAVAICTAYPALNRDLLVTGVLFHDCGKLWEMCPPEEGFEIPRELVGELLGHISIGIEVVNGLWRKLPLDTWTELAPTSEEVRLHLLHLIASHHGELQYGSPIEPKTPEALALHYVDNLDARLEMIYTAYAKQPEIAPGVYERVRALNTSPVAPLPKLPSEQ